MKLTRENIYINLQGKSKEELTELYWLLKNNNEDILNNNIDYFIECYLNTRLVSYNFHFCCESWSCATLQSTENKTEVTIQQLKEILQPMESTEFLQQQLEKAEAEVKRLKEAIEDNKIKIGDWVKRVVRKDCRVFKINDTHNLEHYNNKIYSKIYSKIQDQELINKLNALIK